MKIKRLFFGVLVLSGLLALSSCGSSSNDSNNQNEEGNGNENVDGLNSSEYGPLNPKYASSAGSSDGGNVNLETLGAATVVADDNETPGTLFAGSGSLSEIGEVKVTSVSGTYEGAYIIFNKVSSATGYNVSIKKKSESSFKLLDDKNVYVSEVNSTTMRADILGLSKGEYDFKITTSNNASESFPTTGVLNVAEYDRSGYAHFKYNNGIGAYNNDGTLKSNADVIYVSNATKNTVTYGGKTGLVKILTTTWDKPIDIRILDRIETTQFNEIIYKSTPKTSALLEEQSASLGNTYAGYTAEEIIDNEWNSYSNDLAAGITTLDGLSSKVSCKNGEFDTAWNNCSISDKSFITIEGIGKNAGLYQWGFTWSKCNSIEVKNLEFTDYTEDACSFQSGGNGDVKNYGNFWVHNNTFNRGKNNWDFTYEQDKHYGDGATDFKNIHNVTSAYNVFNNCKKTGLVGGGDDNYTMNITFHHNLYNSVGSRLPLGRQANMHIYNNYYLNCGTCQDIRANAFVLSEANYFKSSSNPQKNTVTTKTATAAESLVVYPYTVIKSYNDYFESTNIISTTSSTNSKGLITTTGPATVVTTRDQQLSGNCKPDGSTNYTNFDTNPELFYYDSTSKKSDVDILNNVTDLPTLLPAVAGSGKFANLSFDAAADVTDPIEPEDPEDPITPDTPTSTKTLLNEEFSSSITPTKTTGIPTSAGLFYSLTNDKDANTYNYVKVENGTVTVYDNSSKTSSDTDDGTSTTTYAYYMFNNDCTLNNGVVTYSVDLILETENTKWSMLSFIDENGLSLSVRSDENKYLGYATGSETVTTITNSAYKKGTYNIKLIIDYDNDKATLYINDDYKAISYTPSTIKGLYFMTSAGSARTYKFDNVKIEIAE